MEPDARRQELVDIVDEHDTVIATVPRFQMRRDNLRHRGVAIVVLDRSHRLLVHRRAETKDVWPSYWDLAAGGVVAAGETYDIAAGRELAEELGIEDAELEHLGVGSFSDDAVSVIAHTYLARHGGPVQFTDGEVAEARWVTPVEFRALRDEFTFCPDSIAVALPLLADHVPVWADSIGYEWP
jgi:isopentenyldiphosphate isomerase